MVGCGPVGARPDPVRSGPWPIASSTRSQGIVNSVPGRRLGAAPAGRVGRAGLHPDELDAGDACRFLSVMTRVGPAWKMAVTPSSIASWTSFAAGMSFMSRR